MSGNLLAQTLELLLEVNETLKRQADERETLFTKMRESSSKQFREHLQELQSENNELKKKQQLDYVNTRIKELDFMHEQHDHLIREVEQLEQNHESRDELIKILREYCQQEEALIYQIVSNYSEAEKIKEETRRDRELFQQLSSNDARVKAMEIIRKRPQGMSITQLSFLLGTSQYQAQKIIAELEDLGLIIRRHSLLKFNNPVEIGKQEIPARKTQSVRLPFVQS